MSEAVEKLRPALELLKFEERIEVIDLLNEMEGDGDGCTEQEHWEAWKAEIERRVHRMDTEGSRGMLWTDFEKILQEKYGETRDCRGCRTDRYRGCNTEFPDCCKISHEYTRCTCND